MNSIAIWYEENVDSEQNSTPALDVHINHWKLKIRMNAVKKTARAICTKTIGRFSRKLSFNDSDFFMDIGLMVTNGAKVGNVCIYIPHIGFDKKYLEDLGSKLRIVRMLTAVFNEPLTLNSGTAKHFEVLKDGSVAFSVFELSVDHDLQISHDYQGTIIKFKHRQFGETPTYYRFRIKGGFVNNLSLTYTPSNFLFESAYSKIEVIDFRINDTRNLDVSLIEHITKNRRFNLTLVHYFVMRSLKDDYIISNQKINSVRQLEKNTWSTYITEKEYRYDGTFAYHLKTKVSPADVAQNKFIDDFTAVFKFQYEDSKLLRYIVGFLLIAIIIELGGNKAYDYLSERYSSKATPKIEITNRRPVEKGSEKSPQKSVVLLKDSLVKENRQ